MAIIQNTMPIMCVTLRFLICSFSPQQCIYEYYTIIILLYQLKCSFRSLLNIYLIKSIRFQLLASGEISHLLSGENDQSQSDRNNQCISFSFL